MSHGGEGFGPFFLDDFMIFLDLETWEDYQLWTLIYQIVAFVGFGSAGSALGGGFGSWTAYITTVLTTLEFFATIVGLMYWWPTYFTDAYVGEGNAPNVYHCFRSWRWNMWRTFLSPLNGTWAIIAALVWGLAVNNMSWWVFSQFIGGLLMIAGTWMLQSILYLWKEFDEDGSIAEDYEFDFFSHWVGDDEP